MFITIIKVSLNNKIQTELLMEVPVCILKKAVSSSVRKILMKDLSSVSVQ